MKTDSPSVRTLWWLSMKAHGHRIRHDLGGELAVLASAGVLAALFLYMFNDFINVEVRSLSAGLQRILATGVGIVILVTSALFAGRMIAEEDDPTNSFSAAARLFGTPEESIRAFRLLRQLTVSAVIVGAGWLIAATWFLDLQWFAHGILVALSFGIATVWARMSGRVLIADAGAADREIRRTTGAARGSPEPESRSKSILSWRLAALRRGIPALPVIGFALLGIGVALALLALRGAPPFALALLVIAVTWTASIPTALLLARDLPHAWIDKAAGITHEEFNGAYQRLAVRVALVSLGITIVTLVPAIIAGTLIMNIKLACSLAGIAITAPLCLSATQFQVDARRPAISVLANFIITLFVATAIYAHPLASILLVAIWFWGHDAQRGRFYRA